MGESRDRYRCEIVLTYAEISISSWLKLALELSGGCDALTIFDPPIREEEIRCETQKKAPQISNLLFIYRLSFLLIAFCIFFYLHTPKKKQASLFGCLFIVPSYRRERE